MGGPLGGVEGDGDDMGTTGMVSQNNQSKRGSDFTNN